MCAANNFHTSIIIPTRNHGQMLTRLINGLIKTAESFNQPLELIVVDNNSDERDTLDYLASMQLEPPTCFANIQVLHYPDKFNFSAINNLAASKSRAQFLCFLNNDIEVIDSSWLQALHQPMTYDKTGCVGAMLYYPDNTIQHAGVYLDKDNIAGHLYKNLPRGASGNKDFLISEQSVSAVTAACLLVSRSIFNEVSGFNESLKVAFNDVDFCLRIQQAGYKNVWTPHSQLYHHESKSRGLNHQRTWLQKINHKKEVNLMKYLWGEQLANEPHYAAHVASLRSESD